MNEFIDSFRNTLHRNGFLPGQASIMLCVSGGIDSVVMTDLFVKLGYTLGIAHVNFGLRGSASAEDEMFTEQLAKHYGVEFFVLHASDQMAELHKGESTQMAARRIRYDWFDQLLESTRFTHAATAHHADDEAETFFINMNRGTGSKGISGYDYQRGRYIKPLIDFTRAEIEQYALENQLLWRQDASNSEDIYLRNRVRKTIMPAIREVFPDFVKRSHQTFIRLKRERKLLDNLLSDRLKELTITTKHGLEIQSDKLQDYPDPAMILFELIREFGFSMADCESISKNLTQADGQCYLAGGWKARLERGKIFIFNQLHESDCRNPNINVVELHKMPDFTGAIPRSEAYIDLDKLGGSLYLKKWEKGDQFWPSGMEGRKLVSDYLNGLKLPFTERKNQYLLMSGNEVVWLVNYRIDRRFAANKYSTKILKVQVS